MPNSLSIYTDGGARGNPGPAAIGFVVKDQTGKIIYQHGQTIGPATNNVAEYQAVIAALKWLAAVDRRPSAVSFYLDSKLVANQLAGNYKIKDLKLKTLWFTARELIIQLSTPVSFTTIPRAQNSLADSLVNLALDRQI